MTLNSWSSGLFLTCTGITNTHLAHFNALIENLYSHHSLTPLFLFLTLLSLSRSLSLCLSLSLPLFLSFIGGCGRKMDGGRVSLYSPGWSRTHFVSQVGLEIKIITCLGFPHTRIKTVCHHNLPIFPFLKVSLIHSRKIRTFHQKFITDIIKAIYS